MNVSKDLVAASATPLVLAILAEGDSYGYAILKRVSDLSGGELQWADGDAISDAASAGTAWLRRGELADLGNRTEAQYYRVTKEGLAQLAIQRRQWQVVDATLRGNLAEDVTCRAPCISAISTGEAESTMDDGGALEHQITLWRDYLRRREAIHSPDVEELESHLRDQVAALEDAGLTGDEAFLVAVKRMGSLDALSREFARNTPSGCGNSSSWRPIRQMNVSAQSAPRLQSSSVWRPLPRWQ